ncbi:arsenate reductase ArsC [Amycolatopsis sp. OK19-0408]|uniref:Arsenate reductase ArsC n=1 Tax=Amycolatopsis iheyensis TaxID=2945988 RepID=A0A9X2NJN1_9PSEU|nr:arsenate reductase ArsC [Amycolatopsis iheyensis]MCR6489012.1 arsenate reductase ArsC [Amycolatopsis iheyensis]
MSVPEVLFVCIHNAGRSQMAAAFLRHHGGDRVVVRSAGSAPADTVNPAVVLVMAERGIDISGEHPKKLTTESVERSDVVITMGCGDACPIVPGTRYLDWKLEDPAGRPAEEIRPVRDDIERRVQDLLSELTGATAGRAASDTGTAATVSAPSTRNAVE